MQEVTIIRCSELHNTGEYNSRVRHKHFKVLTQKKCSKWSLKSVDMLLKAQRGYTVRNIE